MAGWFGLALRNLVRHRPRTTLCLLGITVTGALLMDMVMLSRGIESSLETILHEIGYEIRLCPKDVLPLATEAEIGDGHSLAASVRQHPEVAAAACLAVTTLYLRKSGGESVFPAFALGLERDIRRSYRIYAGQDLSPGDPHYAAGTFTGPETGEIIVNRILAEAEGISVGDSLQLSPSFNAALRLMNAPHTYTVRGLADFRFDLQGQYSVALHTSEVQTLAGQVEGDRVAMVIVKLRDPDRTEAVEEELAARYPHVTVYSIGGYLRQLETQLFYFKQFAWLLSTVSLIVTFLLVVSIVTISFNERLGEMALLRAVGFSPWRVAAMVWSEGLLLAVASVLPALTMGLVASYPLNAVLSQSPSLPQDLQCLVLTPRAVVGTSVLLLATGGVAGLYPAWRAARLPLGATLHREIV